MLRTLLVTSLVVVFAFASTVTAFANECPGLPC